MPRGEYHMEDWELDFEWLRIRHWVKARLHTSGLPDMNAILLMIGIQELGRVQQQFSKEEKQDLLHIAACRLLSYDGYYVFEGLDADEWPHWKLAKPFGIKGEAEQERYMKQLVVRYFKEMNLS